MFIYIYIYIYYNVGSINSVDFVLGVGNEKNYLKFELF